MGEHRDGEPGRGCALTAAAVAALWIGAAVLLYLAVHH